MRKLECCSSTPSVRLRCTGLNGHVLLLPRLRPAAKRALSRSGRQWLSRSRVAEPMEKWAFLLCFCFAVTEAAGSAPWDSQCFRIKGTSYQAQLHCRKATFAEASCAGVASRSAPALGKKRAQWGCESKKYELHENAFRIKQSINYIENIAGQPKFCNLLKLTKSRKYFSFDYYEPSTYKNCSDVEQKKARMLIRANRRFQKSRWPL